MSFFEHSSHPSFHNSHFAAAQGNIYNIYNNSSSNTTQLRRKDRDGWPESVNNFEKIKMGNIKLLNTLRTQQLEMQIKDGSPDLGLQETNPFQIRIAQQNNMLKAVKVIRSVHTATIHGRGSEKFTVVNYRVVEGNGGNTYVVCKPEFDFWSQRRHAKLPQLFGVAHSFSPALIYHNAHVNAMDVLNHYETTPTIPAYLNILHLIDDEEVFSFAPEILEEFTPISYWEFEFSTQSFCYTLDFPINTHVNSQVQTSNNPQYCFTDYTGIWNYLRQPQIPPPALDNTLESRLDIISYVSQITGEYLDSISMLGRMDLNVDPLDIALDGLIPFSACFKKEWDNVRGPILASFQSLDLMLEWVPRWWKSTVDIEITNWKSVNSQVRISFLNWQQGGDFHFCFSLALPRDMKRHVRGAFLSQSFVFMKKSGIDLDSLQYCYLLDHIHFDIKGQFKPLSSSSATSSVSIYLFIDPLKTEMINGLPCLKYSPEGLFIHWSLNPDGPGTPVDVDEYGLPQIEIQMSFGSWWCIEDYKAVLDYLHSKGYDPYSTAYAEEQGYPLLTYRNVGEEVETETETSVEDVADVTASTAFNANNSFEVASHTSKLRQIKRIGSKIRRFVDSFAKREKKH
ncbi:hypothetical protein Moror_8589 [Moniliophthora roreri MCA 2997]|uniref:Uncharacterized protein n=2 Tax=Moniliophthora roreri TaxID=221103 RepID=V2XA68_MONRO|nr:hypothetical protein Moror_8589 [Moniliophthora roreri MCA 2997]KAI3596369.1 hypothetical protein WG66_003110 [Moniliophthora roreri]